MAAESGHLLSAAACRHAGVLEGVKKEDTALEGALLAETAPG